MLQNEIHELTSISTCCSFVLAVTSYSQSKRFDIKERTLLTDPLFTLLFRATRLLFLKSVFILNSVFESILWYIIQLCILAPRPFCAVQSSRYNFFVNGWSDIYAPVVQEKDVIHAIALGCKEVTVQYIMYWSTRYGCRNLWPSVNSTPPFRG